MTVLSLSWGGGLLAARPEPRVAEAVHTLCTQKILRIVWQKVTLLSSFLGGFLALCPTSEGIAPATGGSQQQPTGSEHLPLS
ncbi:hypothetical protein A4R35_16185 [Thermogemmatispora tikiterensis]|uniref:Uncharacterized protein n=1 Tax=Thermogemmatispora tikiterensis TaxID=1825093 RepID=A0A328VJ40_9CHLR|nr:hypothetical protein A4R35_16185 [Thermogemmatispora tikiterensis]